MKTRLSRGLAVFALVLSPLLAFAPIRVDANNDGPGTQPPAPVVAQPAVAR